MSSLYFLVALLAILRVETRNTGENPRLFGYTYTSTEYTTKYVTSLMPSSCVHVAPTLPPCRNVRYLKFPQVAGFPFFKQAENNEISSSTPSVTAKPPVATPIHSTPLGWGEYLGIYAPTVTVTETEIKVATVQDPKTVVTFAIKGCRPLRLPTDLDRCPPDANPFIDELAPTSASGFIETTSMLRGMEPPLELPKMKGTILRNLGGSYQGSFLEPSSSIPENSVDNKKPTQALRT